MMCTSFKPFFTQQDQLDADADVHTLISPEVDYNIRLLYLKIFLKNS